MRASYRFTDGRELDNAFTDAGLDGFLKAAFRNEYPAALYVGLCTAVPSRGLTLGQINEPSIGVNGYSRIALTRSAAGWPLTGIQGGDPFIETVTHTFVASGGDFNVPITRLFLTDEQTSTIGDVWGLSAAIQFERVITPTTLLAERQFNYRVYGI